MELVKSILLCFIGFSGGVVISGAVFAFIAIIGIVPRLAQKTKTSNYIKWYEDMIIVGGIFGATTIMIDYYIPTPTMLVIFYSFCIGIFFGCLAVSLAEVLDAIPIITRRVKVREGIKIFIFALALGKLIGSLMYFRIPGFYNE